MLDCLSEPLYQQGSNPTQSTVLSVRSLTRDKDSNEYTTKYLSSVNGSKYADTSAICTTEERDSNI
jgi:hypothetical protein